MLYPPLPTELSNFDIHYIARMTKRANVVQYIRTIPTYLPPALLVRARGAVIHHGCSTNNNNWCYNVKAEAWTEQCDR